MARRTIWHPGALFNVCPCDFDFFTTLSAAGVSHTGPILAKTSRVASPSSPISVRCLGKKWCICLRGLRSSATCWRRPSAASAACWRLSSLAANPSLLFLFLLVCFSLPYGPVALTGSAVQLPLCIQHRPIHSLIFLGIVRCEQATIFFDNNTSLWFNSATKTRTNALRIMSPFAMKVCTNA